MSPRRKTSQDSGPVGFSASRHIRPHSLRQQVAEALERDILTGIFAPGQRLIERELVDRFGVSSIPVREALQDLENRGLVIKRPNAGCSVIELTAKEADQICELRRILEPVVVRWAAERYCPEADQMITARLAELEQAAANGDMAAFFHADLMFHKAIWETAGNRWASLALEAAVGSLFASGLMAAARMGTLDMTSEASAHRKLVELLRAGKASQASALLSGIANRFERTVGYAIGEKPADA